MIHTEVVIDSQTFRLGHRIGKGGEGAVYAIGDDRQYAVKIYTTHDFATKESKIEAMVRAKLAGTAPLVAFPISVAKAKSGAFLGFVMKLVVDHKPLHDLYSPGSRKQHFPQADYRFLVRAAANFARAMASVHQSKCVIGDINHSGILVSPKATVSLIDADSFQFSDSGRQFLCQVGVPEYTPPELQGKSLGGILRTQGHDAFGMAVVIFQLLFMGRHPFVGTVRRGDIPPLHENIQNFRYAYAETRDVGMDQPPGTPALSDFSPGLAGLFEDAFSRQNADQRPTAEQWIKQLDALEQSLGQCQENPLHYVPRDASECAWCEMERQTGSILFLPYIPGARLQSENFDPGAAAFNLDAIWVRIDSVIRTLAGTPQPQINATTVEASLQAKQARDGKSTQKPFGYVLMIVATVLLFAAPMVWILWLILAYWGYSMVTEVPSRTFDSTPFRRAHAEAEARWSKAISDWYARLGYTDFIDLKKELIAARDAYKALDEEERQLRAKYQDERRQRHLSAFLDQFDIQKAKIHGIGQAKQAVLASYGIDTAADISKSRLLSVPGFGDVNSRGLLEWRAELEKKFVYHLKENDTDRQELARIRALIAAKAVPLRKKLSVGPQNMETLARRIKQAVSNPDPGLAQIQRQRDQANADIAYLGILVTQPSTPAPHTSTKGPGGGSTYSKPSSTSTPTCPRCGSSMVRRTARRGRNAGGQFWGCSRYPRCKGTRNI